MKNECFIKLFNSLLSKKDDKLQLYLYTKKDGDFFDSDYLYLEYVYDGDIKGYIGLIGESNRDIFRFNSIYIDSENKVSGKKVEVSDLFVESLNYYKSVSINDVIKSPRNINHFSCKKIKKKRKFKLDKNNSE